MTVAIRLKREHIDAMVAHALDDAPIECCGLLASDDGTLAEVIRAKNKEASPYRSDIHPHETKRRLHEIAEKGHTLAGFYHSCGCAEAGKSGADDDDICVHVDDSCKLPSDRGHPV